MILIPFANFGNQPLVRLITIKKQLDIKSFYQRSGKICMRTQKDPIINLNWSFDPFKQFIFIQIFAKSLIIDNIHFDDFFAETCHTK